MTPARQACSILLLGLLARDANAQIVQRNAQARLPAPYNDTFAERHPDAARSFYPAHYAHFGIYEVGLVAGERIDAEMAALEERIRGLIERPPRFETPVDLVAPSWVKIGYSTAVAMDWTHHLHSQLYDILSDDRVADKQAAGERAISYYLTNGDAAFSTRGYGHAFMLGGGSWAGTFAERYPSLNGILWAYHWHHAAVYEALMEPDSAQRRVDVDRVIRVFRDSVLPNPPAHMPLTGEVAPRFSAMFPAAAHIFDNLHMMHDVVNDIMVDARIGPGEKGGEVDRMLRQMTYANQEWVVPPAMPAGDHGHMMMMEMIPPTQLPDGRWLPQGHPDGGAMGMDHRNHIRQGGSGSR